MVRRYVLLLSLRIAECLIRQAPFSNRGGALRLDTCIGDILLGLLSSSEAGCHACMGGLCEGCSDSLSLPFSKCTTDTWAEAA